MGVSVSDPITPAINRAKFICFQPFNIGKWFAMGFIAFLASLGEGGSSNFRTPNFPGGGTTPRVPAPTVPTVPSYPGRTPSIPNFPRSSPTPAQSDPFQEISNWTGTHVVEAVVIGLLILIAIFAIVLVIMWISARGKFMFIEAVANNTTEIKASWARYKELGNALFKFRIMLTLIGFATAIVAGGIGLALAWSDIQSKSFNGGAIAGILVAAALLIPIGIALGVIGWCTEQFVTVIMYATGQLIGPAWAEFRQHLLPGNKGSFVLFFLMQIVFAIATGLLTLVIGCATCCLGFLPYLSSVATLPLAVFLRSYSIYFMQQFGPRYQIIVEAPPMSMTYGFPVMQPGMEGYPQPPYPPQTPPQPGDYPPPPQDPTQT